MRAGLVGIALIALFFFSKPAARWAIGAGVLSLSFLVVFYLLGEGSLHDWDEAIYAQVAKEAANSEDWVTLTWAGASFWHKPPLYFWLTALLYKAVGINEFAARFWSAAFGFGVVTLTFLFGRRLFSWPVGIGAALLLLSIDQSGFCHWYNFVCQARVGMLETTLTFWMILSLILVWEANERPRLLILMGVTAGLAVMTKAWIGFFALAVPLLYALMSRQFHGQRRHWTLAILLAGLVILPWHVWQIWMHGSSFVHDYFLVNVFGRMTGVIEEHQHSPFFYLDILAEGFAILGSGYLWPAAYLWAAWTARTREYRAKLLLLIWVTIPLLLSSLAQTKIGWYIILVYPGIALLMAAAISDFIGGSRAIAIVALAAGIFYFRLPAVVDGSPDVKQFAKGVARIVSPNDRLYVYTEQEPTSGMLTQHHYRGAQNVRPSLIYYLDRPLACVAINDQYARERTSEAYVIVETQSLDPARNLDPILLRHDPYILTRLHGLSFHTC